MELSSPHKLETGRIDENNATQLCGTYKRLILDPKTLTGLKVKGGKTIFHTNSNHKRAEELALILNKNRF